MGTLSGAQASGEKDAPTPAKIRFVIIGAGRLGCSMALALSDRGATLAGFICGTAAGTARAERWLRRRAAADLDELVSFAPTHYVISVPDDVLPSVAEQLGGRLHEQNRAWPCPDRPTAPPIVMHTSGATSVNVLAPCGQAGAVALAFHPLQTFTEPKSGSARFAGAAVAVTPLMDPGSSLVGELKASSAVEAGFALARRLSARPFLLADEKRVLYHAAACVASNYFVTLEESAKRLFVLAGMPEDQAMQLFAPLVQATLENMVAQGAVEALTGPLARGDERTIARHLAELNGCSHELAALYRHLGVATLDLVRARGELDPEEIATLAGALRDSAISQPKGKNLPSATEGSLA